MRLRNSPSTNQHVRELLLVDDQPILRAGLAHLIGREGDLKICAQTNNIPRALAAIGTLRPDLVIIDIALKHGNGVDFVKKIKALYPDTPVLVLSMQDEALFA